MKEIVLYQPHSSKITQVINWKALKNPEFYFGAYYLVLVNFMITHPNNQHRKQLHPSVD